MTTIPEDLSPSKRAQYAALLAAVEAGPDALLAFAQAEQAKRDASADREWQGYRLVKVRAYNDWQVIQNPNGVRYWCFTTAEGVKKFIARSEWGCVDCPDQAYCDFMNDLLRGHNIVFRLEGKKARIAFLREEAARRGELEWQDRNAPVRAADGQETVSAEGDGDA